MVTGSGAPYVFASLPHQEQVTNLRTQHRTRDRRHRKPPRVTSPREFLKVLARRSWSFFCFLFPPNHQGASLRFDVSQDSCNLLPYARGHSHNLGFSMSAAGQAGITSPATTQQPPPTDGKQHLPRWRLRPRIAAGLVSTALQLSERRDSVEPDWWTRQQVAETVTEEQITAANTTARSLRRIANVARTVMHARFQRGEISAWSKVLDLPADFVDARDELTHYADTIAEDLSRARGEIQPAIEALNAAQRSATSWELPATALATRGYWAGRDHWVEHADACIDTARADGVTLDCSPHNIRALLRGLADFFDASGHGCTAANATIVARAQQVHGATIAESTGVRRLSTITRVLTEHKFLKPQAKGRYLTSIERMAARCHHGNTQHRAANHFDANIPRHLLPTGTPPPPAPAWAGGMRSRLAERHIRFQPGMTVADWVVATAIANQKSTVNCSDEQQSTYTDSYWRFSPPDKNWVTHQRAYPPADTNILSSSPSHASRTSSEPAPPPPSNDNRGFAVGISLRARRIADDLTRHDPNHTLTSGPYSHLLNCGNRQLSLNGLARLIDRYTPEWAGTRDVLAGLVHAATSPTTGHVSLGLRTRPANPTAWMTSVLSRIAWDNPDTFPTRATVDEAYGLTWCGPRREWGNIG